jgi:hypothetical protein
MPAQEALDVDPGVVKVLGLIPVNAVRMGERPKYRRNEDDGHRNGSES